ncbi:MAG TPA: hydantoinase B/oxoprolinase family protein [Streptosporangiaceae bacterium]|nr:hydantoinase B/oxoprolinase family protein [Streptosporangiaceae bacterium]
MAVTLAADVGGTFTDVVLTGDDDRVHVAKTLTTPADPTTGLLRGVSHVLSRARVAPGDVGRFVHATTLATNVILERRGVSVAFVTTEGFRSMLALGRRARVEEERFDLTFVPDEPPVPLTRTFAVPERISAAGEVLRPLDEHAVARIAEEIGAAGCAAVAICLLHSYANPVHERRLAELVAARLPAETPVVVSSDVWPELGEYERATTTLMSAYVGPVMAAYLRRLGAGLRALGVDAPVHVMESAGGVLPAGLAAARAVYTIESGPAAGVIAAARCGAARGLTDLISFDMGGTTAKAGLVRNGRPGVTHEFQVGGKGSFGGRRPGTGVPIKVPAIDLAEVGSGGGSIAWVDAGTLRVGPRSAGADPGPACYGRGGADPTVTDADLLLGYLDPAGFGEFDLSAERAHAAIAAHVAEPLGVDVVTAAAAIHDIAVAQMGAAVHVVTVRRGIDPRGCTLVALGGAAPTHVAGLAERFGIDRVLMPPHCGVGSAVGLLHAELGMERAQTFVTPADSVDITELSRVVAGLEEAARADLALSSMDGGAKVAVSVGVRFIGQAHAFTVGLPGVTRDAIGRAVDEFYRRYRESYGIDLRDPVELTAVRVRVALPAGGPGGPGAAAGDGRRPTGGDDPRLPTRSVWFDGAFRDVPVRARAACAPGEEFAGPHILTEPQSSLVVPPGWRGVVDEDGAVLIERTSSPRVRATLPAAPEGNSDGNGDSDRDGDGDRDGLTAEILRHGLRVAAEEAGIVVVRSAYSAFIIEGADAAAAIFDARGRLISHSMSTAIMQGASLRSALPYVIAAFPPRTMAPGDVFALNDVYQGGIHANDLLIFRPVFVDGAPAYFTGTLIHVADLSGISAGGMAADATDVFLEGVQVPPVRIATADGLVDDLVRLLAANSRTPDHLLGDLRALIAGANVAARRLEELIERHTPAGLAEGVDDYIAHTERRTRAELALLPDGTYRGEYRLDDGQSVRAAVTAAGDGVIVDFDGTDAQVALPINAGFSQTLGGVMYAMRCYVDPALPFNEGCFTPIDVRMPPGSLVNCTPPHPGGGRWPTVAAAVEAIFAALTRARPDRGAAASGILQAFSISGAGGRPWLHMSFELGGMGAGALRDGADATGALFGGGRNIIPQVEPIEARLPLRVEEVSLIADSGGAGRHRGGLGTRTVLRMLADARVDTRGDRLRRPPPGAAGGLPGRAGGYYRERADGIREPLRAKATGQSVAAGEALVVETSGGGGYGDPGDRDPAAVRADLDGGRITG